MRAALLRPWGPLVWRKYFASLFPSGGPEDQAEHAAAVSAALARPGRWRAFQRTARTSHAPAEAALPKVAAPTLVVMGEEDPDFSDPEAEARWAAEALGGPFEMIAEAGHYPMAERAGETLEVILSHLRQNPAHG
jgi:pimeloyl-ACP methyl ester carboxylesterase